MATIKINTGIKVFDIEDENGQIRGQIKIDPSDVNLYPRALKLIENIESYKDGIADDADDIQLITEIDQKIKAEINALFDDENCSDVVFGNKNCLSTLNGITFVERFLTAILPIIKKEADKEAEKSKKRIEKYTSQVK